MRRSPRSDRSHHLALGLALLAAPALAAEPQLDPAPTAQPGVVPGTELPEPVDWAPVGQATARMLSAYMQVDNINPPGNELSGALFLADVLREHNINAEIHEYTPGRANLIARLPSSGEQPPVCLLSHIDVAEADAESWPEGKGPLSGTIDEEGKVWGRGALDMKGMGAIELMAMVELARLQVPLRRDIILLAVADEEVDNIGMQALIEERWDELGCAYVLNEGGVGIRDMFFEGQDVYPISVGEKGVLWVRMVASAEPGHGSTPYPDRSPELLHAAVGKLMERQVSPSYDPSLLELLDNVGAHAGGLPGMVLQSPALIRLVLKGRLMGTPVTRAVLTDTVNVTGYGGALQPNVEPGESWANLDIRTLPGTRSEDVLAELTELVGDERVRFEVLQDYPAAVSEWQDDPVYEALVHRVTEGRPHAVAGPALSPGFTDSIFARPLGVRAYGFVPFTLTEAEAVTMHGNGEHVSIDNLTEGVRVMYRVLVDVAADPEGTWIAPEAPKAPEPEPAPEEVPEAGEDEATGIPEDPDAP